MEEIVRGVLVKLIKRYKNCIGTSVWDLEDYDQTIKEIIKLFKI